MKFLSIPYLDSLDNKDLELAGYIIDDFGKSDAIESVNWFHEYPYKPITLFNIARSNDALFIKYSVHGSMLRAIYTNDLDPVHEDSCVEFFCKIPGNEFYMNFEFNCIGTCNASKRIGRNENVIRFTKSELARIERFSSLGRRVFNEMEGMFAWELTVKIPFDLMGIDPEKLPEKITGNFYKCADGTDSPHFLSWNPIKTEKPDFHRPEYFGELSFQQ